MVLGQWQSHHRTEFPGFVIKQELLIKSACIQHPKPGQHPLYKVHFIGWDWRHSWYHNGGRESLKPSLRDENQWVVDIPLEKKITYSGITLVLILKLWNVKVSLDAQDFWLRRSRSQYTYPDHLYGAPHHHQWEQQHHLCLSATVMGLGKPHVSFLILDSLCMLLKRPLYYFSSPEDCSYPCQPLSVPTHANI